MLPNEPVCWPKTPGGELDINEYLSDYGNNTNIPYHATYHYGWACADRNSLGQSYPQGDLTADYHIYGVEWNASTIRFFLDGTTTNVIKAGQLDSKNNQVYVMSTAAYMILNTAIGGVGSWPAMERGLPNNTNNVWPAYHLVDWVRAYVPNGSSQQYTPTGSTPYGSMWQIPGWRDCYNFDAGGPGVAYSDFDATNNGGQYRTTEGVDIYPEGENSYSIGWTAPNEWMIFTLNATAAAYYDWSIRASSDQGNAPFHLELDGRPLGTPLRVPLTTGMVNVTLSNLYIAAGTHQLRLYVEDWTNMRLGRMTFSLSVNPLASSTVSDPIAYSPLTLAWQPLTQPPLLPTLLPPVRPPARRSPAPPPLPVPPTPPPSTQATRTVRLLTVRLTVAPPLLPPPPPARAPTAAPARLPQCRRPPRLAPPQQTPAPPPLLPPLLPPPQPPPRPLSATLSL